MERNIYVAQCEVKCFVEADNTSEIIGKIFTTDFDEYAFEQTKGRYIYADEAKQIADILKNLNEVL